MIGKEQSEKLRNLNFSFSAIRLLSTVTCTVFILLSWKSSSNFSLVFSIFHLERLQTINRWSHFKKSFMVYVLSTPISSTKHS